MSRPALPRTAPAYRQSRRSWPAFAFLRLPYDMYENRILPILPIDKYTIFVYNGYIRQDKHRHTKGHGIMELLSKEILDQIRAAKAQREAVEPKVEAEDEEYSSFDPIRDIEADADPEMEDKRGMWKASW